MWRKRNERDTERSQETLAYIQKYLHPDAAPSRCSPTVAHSRLLASPRRGRGTKAKSRVHSWGHNLAGVFTGVARSINQPVGFRLIHFTVASVTSHWLKAAPSHWLLGRCGQASLGANFSGALLLPRGGGWGGALEYIKQFQNGTTPLGSDTATHKGCFTGHSSEKSL